MRAIVVRHYGGPGALEVVDVPVPEPRPGQLRIKVAAAALNPVDVETRDGSMIARGGIAVNRASVGLGWDVAGTVDAIGPDVEGFAIGEQVIGLRDVLDVPIGAYADYLVFDADAFAPAPTTADLVAASTLPLNGLTADQALDLVDLREGQTLLVPGAAGGVGGFLVELAAQRGLHVVAVAGALDAAQLRSWGAKTFIRRSDDLAGSVRAVFPDGVDAAIDAVPLPDQVLPAVRDGGRYVTMTPYTPPQTQRGITLLTQTVHYERDRLARLAGLVDEGRLTLRVAATFPLDEARAAHELLAKGGQRGRIVLIP